MEREFHARTSTLSKSLPCAKLQRSHDPRCCALLSVSWVMYEEPNFRGRMYIVERGDYSSHNEWQAQNPNIQSIRRVVNYF